MALVVIARNDSNEAIQRLPRFARSDGEGIVAVPTGRQ